MMDKELNLSDLIKPIWSERYSILLHLTLFVMLVVSLFSLLAYVVDINKNRYWLQDISFNENINESAISNFLNHERIKSAYQSADLDYIRQPGAEINNLTLLKGSSRFEVLKNTILLDAEELLINVINEEDDTDGALVNFWNNFLNLDTFYYQIALYDESLTDLQAQMIISELINNFNYDYIGPLNTNKIGNLSFDPDIKTFIYLNNRLSAAKSILESNIDNFKLINVDAGELIFRIDKLLLQIYNEDPSPLEESIEKLDFEIKSNIELKQELENLHTKFYKSSENINTSENPSQITVDAITQLIDIGKEFSELDYQENIIESVYNIDLSIKSLELQIFDMLALKKRYFLEDNVQLSKDEMNDIARKIIKDLNLNIETFDSYNYELPLYYIGNSYKKTDSKYNINVILLVIISTMLYLVIYISNLFYRKNNYKT